jgi:hypothetical protein
MPQWVQTTSSKCYVQRNGSVTTSRLKPNAISSRPIPIGTPEQGKIWAVPARKTPAKVTDGR